MGGISIPGEEMDLEHTWGDEFDWCKANYGDYPALDGRITP